MRIPQTLIEAVKKAGCLCSFGSSLIYASKGTIDAPYNFALFQQGRQGQNERFKLLAVYVIDTAGRLGEVLNSLSN